MRLSKNRICRLGNTFPTFRNKRSITIQTRRDLEWFYRYPDAQQGALSRTPSEANNGRALPVPVGFNEWRANDVAGRYRR